MIKINLICNMAVAGRNEEQVAVQLARVIADRSSKKVASKEDEEDEEEARAATELKSTILKAEQERILEACNAFAFVKHDLSLLVREDYPHEMFDFISA
jgi:hypothetical protein